MSWTQVTSNALLALHLSHQWDFDIQVIKNLSIVYIKSRVCCVFSLSKNSRALATVSLITYMYIWTSTLLRKLTGMSWVHSHATYLSCQINSRSCVWDKPNMIPCQLLAGVHQCCQWSSRWDTGSQLISNWSTGSPFCVKPKNDTF